MRSLLTAGISVIALCIPVQCQEQIEFNIPVKIAVDPSSKSGSGVLEVRNVGSASEEISLWAGDFESLTTGHNLNAKTTFSDESSNGPKAIYTRTVPARKSITIKIDVSNVWEAGESHAVLHSGASIVGYISAVNDRFPLNVSVTSAGTNSEFKFVRGTPASLTFKNGDAMSYPIRWAMRVKGTTTEGSDIRLPANGVAFADFRPPDEWFSSPFTTLFRDEERQGDIILWYAPEPNTRDFFYSTKVLPVTIKLNYWHDGKNELVGYSLIFSILVLGGVTSLMLTFGIPNRLKRLDLKEKIATLSNTISAISHSVDSRLRVLLRVERKRLYELLASRRAYSPDLTDIFSEIEGRLTSATMAIGVVNRLDSLRQELAELAMDGLGPTLLDQVETTLQQCAIILRQPQVSSTDLATARDLANKAEELLQTRKADSETTSALALRVEALSDFFKALPEADRNELKQAFSFLLSALDDKFKNSANIPLSEIPSLDDKLCRLDLLKRFVPISKTNASQDFADAVSQFNQEIVRQGWYSFRHARLYLQEMEQGIFPPQLLEALKYSKNAGIPPIGLNRSPRQNQPLEFSIIFSDDVINHSAAKDGWHYKWDFGDGLVEHTTWTVWHYYRSPGPYTVQVSFQDSHGRVILDGDKPLTIPFPLRVEPETKTFFGERAKIELIKLGIALFAAGVGLIAGAREQLIKLDVVPGLIAVFLAGFGADTIKNLINK